MMFPMKQFEDTFEKEAQFKPLDDLNSQLFLMKFWADNSDIEVRNEDELALLWTEKMAQKFRVYVFEHPDKQIDLNDEKKLRELLDEISTITIH